MRGKNRKFKRWTSSFLAALLLISTFLPSSLIGKAHAEQANHLVISQVYGAGGNASSIYKNDFIEIYNPTDTAVDLTGWTVQYASKAGAFSTAPANTTNLAGTIPAYGYYLVQEAAGAGTQPPLPNEADVKTGAIAMGASDGK